MSLRERPNEVTLVCVCCGNVCETQYLNICMKCYVKYRYKWVESGKGENLNNLLQRIIALCREHNKEIIKADNKQITNGKK